MREPSFQKMENATIFGNWTHVLTLLRVRADYSTLTIQTLHLPIPYFASAPLWWPNEDLPIGYHVGFC